jgi:hypothetical protein
MIVRSLDIIFARTELLKKMGWMVNVLYSFNEVTNDRMVDLCSNVEQELYELNMSKLKLTKLPLHLLTAFSQ